RSLPIQFLVYLGNAVRGNLGISIQSRQPVATLLAERFPFTLRLAFLAILVSAALGVVAGVIAATRRNSIIDVAALLGSLVGISLPIFWLGLLMMLVFSVRLQWFPAGGSGTAAHLVLPALVLGAASSGVIARMTRASMLEVLRQDYVRTAMAQEYSRRFGCEQGFRDAKRRLGFAEARVQQISAWSRYFALFAIALLALATLGAKLLVVGGAGAQALLRRVCSRRRGRCEL